MTKRFAAVAFSAVLAVPTLTAAGPSCRDPWITQALVALGKGSAADQGEQGLCNINRYRGGQWSSQSQLNDAVRHSFDCSDPWIGQAFVEIRSAPPIVANGINECDPSNYGSWNGFPDLKQKVTAYLDRQHAAAAANRPWGGRAVHDYLHGSSIFTGAFIETAHDVYIFKPSEAVSVKANDSYVIHLPDQTFTITGVISDDGHSFTGPAQVVASGGDNIVAAGAGNLISQDGAGLISQEGGSIMRAIAAIVASGAGNIVSTNSGNAVPTIASLLQSGAQYVPSSSASFTTPFSNDSGAQTWGRSQNAQAIAGCRDTANTPVAQANVALWIAPPNAPKNHRYYALLKDVTKSDLASPLVVGFVCKSDAIAHGWERYGGSFAASPAAPAIHLTVHDSAPGDATGWFLITNNNDAFHFAAKSARLTRQPNGSYNVETPVGFFTLAADGTPMFAGTPVRGAGVGTITASGPSASARAFTDAAKIAWIGKQIAANGIISGGAVTSRTYPTPAAPPAAASMLSADDLQRRVGRLTSNPSKLAANGLIPFSTAYRQSDRPLMFFATTQDVIAYRHRDLAQACGPYVMLLDGKKYAEKIPSSAVPQVLSFACKNDALAVGFSPF